MKAVYRLMMSVIIVSMLAACETKQEWWDSGVSSPYHDCSMMEYLRGDDYNWELTVALIERAGLIDLFEGRVDTLPAITFLAPPSYSVLRYLWDNGKEEITDLPVSECREMVLKHVIKGKYLKEDIAYRNPDYLILDAGQDGYTDLTCLSNNKLRLWKDKSPWAGVPDVGPESMYIYSFEAEQNVPLATPNIQPKNGVVHALNYNYVLGTI